VVRLDAVESAINVLWDFTCGFEFKDVGFEAGGLVETFEESCIGEFHLIAGAAAGVVGWDWRCGKRKNVSHGCNSQ
jgi:hypothetical protein